MVAREIKAESAVHFSSWSKVVMKGRGKWCLYDRDQYIVLQLALVDH